MDPSVSRTLFLFTSFLSMISKSGGLELDSCDQVLQAFMVSTLVLIILGKRKEKPALRYLREVNLELTKRF